MKVLATVISGVCLMGSIATADLITNGDFDTFTSPPPTAFQLTFDGTPNWFNRGTGGQTATARAETLSASPASGYNGVINDRTTNAASPGTILFSQNTGYAIEANDNFSLSYDWRDAGNWQAADTVRFVLFATADNVLGGSVVWSSILDSGSRVNVGEWESVSLQLSGVVNGAAVGQNLFVNFYGYDTSGAPSTTAGFARVDNIVVSVIPEPGTFALCTLAMGLIFGLRRKLRG